MTTIAETNDIGELLQYYLSQSPKVRNLVDGRIRPDALDDNEALPAIRYEVMGADQAGSLEGASGFAISRVQFDCYALTRHSANHLGYVVADVLDGYVGTLQSVRVWDCTLDNKYNRKEAPTKGSSQWRYVRVIDFEVSHSEPIPTLTP